MILPYTLYNARWKEYAIYLPIERGPFLETAFEEEIRRVAKEDWQM